MTEQRENITAGSPDIERHTACGPFRPGGFALTKTLLDWLAPTGEDAFCLLDVGCGDGSTLRWLRERKPQWTLIGADPAYGGASPKDGAIRFLNVPADALGLRDGSVDAVLTECSLSRIEDPVKALREIHRVLKPDGRLLISDMYRRAPKEADGPGGKEGMPGGKDSTDAGQSALSPGPCAIGRLDTAEEIRDLLERAGFHLNRMQDVSRVLGDWIVQKIMDGEGDRLCELLGADPGRLRRLRCGYYLCEAVPSPLPELIRRVCEKSAFYKDLYGADVPARCQNGFAERECLRTLPTCGADDLRRDPGAFLCVPAKDVARIITLKTSGSEGAPKRIFFTEEDMARTAVFFSHGIRSVVRPGWRVAVFMEGPSRYSVGGLLKEGLSALPAQVSVFGFITDTAKAAGQAEGMDSLIGVPAQIYRLAKEYPELRPATVLLSADNVPEAVIRTVEALWHCRVFTHWGMSETGYGGGVQCSARGGYHLRDADLIVEILDPKTGEPVPEGAYGEITVTTLHRGAMPLIRYRTGDMARLSGGACPCGSLLPRLDRVRGRLHGCVRLPDGGELTLPDLDEILYSECILAYRAEWKQREQQLLVHVLPEKEIRTVSGEHTGTEGAGPCLRERLRSRIRERFGDSFTLCIDTDYGEERRGKRRLTAEPGE